MDLGGRDLGVYAVHLTMTRECRQWASDKLGWFIDNKMACSFMLKTPCLHEGQGTGVLLESRTRGKEQECCHAFSRVD